jgi:hypothetical protein
MTSTHCSPLGLRDVQAEFAGSGQQSYCAGRGRFHDQHSLTPFFRCAHIEKYSVRPDLHQSLSATPISQAAVKQIAQYGDQFVNDGITVMQTLTPPKQDISIGITHAVPLTAGPHKWL